jgi:hypothetical protein
MYNAIFLIDQSTYNAVKNQSVVLQAHDPFKMVVIDAATKLSVSAKSIQNTFTFLDLTDIPNNRAMIMPYSQDKTAYTQLMDYLRANKITVVEDVYNMGIVTIELPRGVGPDFLASSFYEKLVNGSGLNLDSVEQDMIWQIDPHYAFTYNQHWHLGNQDAQTAWDAMAPFASNISSCDGTSNPTTVRDIELVDCCDMPEIAILDLALETNHPDLRRKLGSCGCSGDPDPTFRASNTCTNNWNCIDNNSNVQPVGTSPLESHGTAVTGIAVANNLNNNYVLSISNNYIKAQFLKIGYPLSVGSLYTFYSTTAAIVMAINRATLNPSCVAISMSFGTIGVGPAGSPAASAAFDYARNTARNCKGILIVASAGNFNSTTITSPASDPNVLAIAASTLANTKASFSNYGSGVFAAAPGVTIRTIDRTGTNGYSTATNTIQSSDADAYATNLATTQMTGTSASTPIVAAIAGCMAAIMPSITAEQMQDTLTNTATPVVGLGAGVVNMAAAIQDIIDLSISEDLTIVPTITASPATVQLCATTPLVFTVNVAVSGANATQVSSLQIKYYASTDAFFTSSDTLLHTQFFPVNGPENYTTSFNIPLNNPTLLNTTKLFVVVTPYNNCGQNISYGTTELIDDAAMTITTGGCGGTDLAVQILSISLTSTGSRVYQIMYTNTGTTTITSANVTRGWIGGASVVQNLTWTGTTGSTAPIQPGQSRFSNITFNTPPPALPANYFHQINTVNGTPDVNPVNNYSSILVN